MRKLINVLISIYLLPVRCSRRLAIYVKGRILTFDEHYYATIDVCRREFGLSKGIIVDIGAYDADSSVYFAKALPDNKIVAFEPNPDPYARAKENSRPYENLEVFNVGFSNVVGKSHFFITKDAVSSSLLVPTANSEVSFRKKVEVDVTTLDTFFKDVEQILLLKLDVQGAELRILHSGIQTLKKTSLVLTEMLNSDMYHGNCKYHELDELLRTNGFQLHSIFSNYNNAGTKYFDALYICNQTRENALAVD